MQIGCQLTLEKLSKCFLNDTVKVDVFRFLEVKGPMLRASDIKFIFKQQKRYSRFFEIFVELTNLPNLPNISVKLK